MSVKFPRHEAALTSLAGLATLALAVAPPTPYLAPALAPLVVTLGAGWLAGRLWLLQRRLNDYHAWHHSPLWRLPPCALPATGDGLFLGRAFRWTGQHTQALESALVQHGALPTGPAPRGGLPALHAVGRAEERPLVVPGSELEGQTGILGTNRSGKTELLKVLASSAIRQRGPTIVVDPKPTRSFLVHCAAEARRAGRRFVLITPAFPQRSASINVLGSARTPFEVTARIKALMPTEGGRPGSSFFTEFPLSLLEEIAAAQQKLGIPWTLEGLYAASTLPSYRADLLTRYLHFLGYGHTGKGVETPANLIRAYRAANTPEPTADALVEDWEHDTAHRQAVTGALRPAFRGVTGEELGHLFSDTKTDITWKNIVEQEMVVYVALGSLLFGDVANRMGRVILQDLVGYLGLRYSYEDMDTALPITLFVDELGDVMYPGFVNAINKGGGAHLRAILAFQSYADLDAAVGREQRQRVLDNLNTLITLRLASDETAEQVAEGYEECLVRHAERSVGLSYGGVGGLSGSAGHRESGTDRGLIRATWLKSLPRGQAFARVKGELFYLRVPLLDELSAAEVDALDLADVVQKLDVTEEEVVCDGIPY